MAKHNANPDMIYQAAAVAIQEPGTTGRILQKEFAVHATPKRALLGAMMVA